MAARFCDRLVLLQEGRVLAEGTPEEVLTPQTISQAFGVIAAVYRDPNTASLAISLIGPADADGPAATAGAACVRHRNGSATWESEGS